jgi:hypothetical protein
MPAAAARLTERVRREIGSIDRRGHACVYHGEPGSGRAPSSRPPGR